MKSSLILSELICFKDVVDQGLGNRNEIEKYLRRLAKPI